MSGGGRDMAGQDRRQAATPVGDRLGRREPWMLFGGGGGKEVRQATGGDRDDRGCPGGSVPRLLPTSRYSRDGWSLQVPLEAWTVPAGLPSG